MGWAKFPFYESGQEDIGPRLLMTQICYLPLLETLATVVTDVKVVTEFTIVILVTVVKVVTVVTEVRKYLVLLQTVLV